MSPLLLLTLTFLVTLLWGMPVAVVLGQHGTPPAAG